MAAVDADINHLIQEFEIALDGMDVDNDDQDAMDVDFVQEDWMDTDADDLIGDPEYVEQASLDEESVDNDIQRILKEHTKLFSNRHVRQVCLGIDSMLALIN